MNTSDSIKKISSFDGNWSLSVDLNGGRIEELKYKDSIILGTFIRLDGKTGNTHICTPNFNDEGMEKYQLPAHGPCRSGEWKVVDQKDNVLEIYFGLEGLGSYPGRLGIYQKFILENESFKQEIRVENLGEEAVPVNIGVHNYFDAELGSQGVRVNGVDVSGGFVRSDYIDLKDINEIEIPNKKKIILEVDGLLNAKLWTNGDFGCIEPVIGKGDYFGSEASLLSKGEIKKVEQIIRVLE